MEKKNTGYLIAIIALAVAVVGMTIGFALTDINLTITGDTVTAKATAWDVHIKEIANAATTGAPTVNVAAKKVESDTEELSATYSVDLNSVGDAYEFDVVVVNDGDYDAKLKAINIEGTSTDYLTHVVTYNSNNYTAASNTISDAPVLAKRVKGTSGYTTSTETFHVKVAYVDPTGTSTTLPDEDYEQTFKVTLVYAPANTTN